MRTIIRTRSPIDSLKRACRAIYWRWRAEQAEKDAEMLKAAAARAGSEAISYEIAARQWREKAWRIRAGLE